jgi:hypothetical protein
MSDVAKWKVQGAVKTLRTENAAWDPHKGDWQPVQHFTLTSFRPDGTISTSDTHNPDGTVAHSRWLYDDAGRLTEFNSWMNDGPIHRAVYFYDESGRHVRTVQLSHDGTETDSERCHYDARGKRTKVRFLDSRGDSRGDCTTYWIEGADKGYSAPGATMMTVTYDGKDLPTEALFEDENHNPISSVILLRDSAGRLINEEMHLGGGSVFLDLVDKVPPEDREGMTSMFKQVFGGTFSSTTYAYDSQGRLIERWSRMGNLGGARTTYQYDDHDDPVDETTEHRSREAKLNENGTVRYSSGLLNVQHNRFEYHYDEHRNWTERLVSIRPEPNPHFQPSNIERRAITYYAERQGRDFET